MTGPLHPQRPSPGPGALRVAGRALVLCLVLAWLGGGILVRQGLRRGELAGHSVRALPRWKMFSSVGVGMTQVRYLQALPEGGLVEVDRFEVMDTSFLEQPRGVWLVQGREEAVRLGLRMCRKLGRGTDLRLHARTQTRNGWKTVTAGKRNLCDPSSGTLR